MSDEVPAIVPPICSITTAQVEVSSSELPPGESVAAPTAEQQFVADHVFTDPHPAVTLIGVLSSAMMLRDVAVDTFDTSGDEDDEEEKPKANEPEA
ncbi:MAG TPA: hypothetical protein VH592_01010 [Gemmataceae bacterium]|jgi:hypothetical protein